MRNNPNALTSFVSDHIQKTHKRGLSRGEGRDLSRGEGVVCREGKGNLRGEHGIEKVMSEKKNKTVVL